MRIFTTRRVRLRNSVPAERTPRTPRRRRHVVVTAVLALVCSSLGAGVAVAAAKTTAKMTTRQVGPTLEVSWTYQSGRPSSQTVQVLDGTRKVSVQQPRAAARKTIFPDLLPGRYTVQLTSKSPSSTTRRAVVVQGVPNAVRDLRVETGDGQSRVSWSTPIAGEFDRPGAIVLVLSGGRDETVRLAADATMHTFTGLDAGKDYQLSVIATNAVGSSPTSTTRIEGDGGVDRLTGSRLSSLQDAEKVFGSFTMVNRSPLGPVDLTNPTQAGLNPVLAALQRCVLASGNGTAIQDGLTNIGGVWATRNATGTLILTSGALALSGTTPVGPLIEAPGLASCVEPALRTQLTFVATQLSSSAKITSVTASSLTTDPSRPELRWLALDGKVLVNGGASGESEQDLQLVWVVAGKDRTVTQYILIRQGDPIDGDLRSRLLDMVAGRHLS